MAWNDDERAGLRVGWADSELRRRDVADLLGRSEASVAQEAYRLRLGRKGAIVVAKPAPAKGMSAAHREELRRRGIAI